MKGMDNYIAMGSVKSAWMAMFIFAIIYGVLYTVYPIFETKTKNIDVEGGEQKPTPFTYLGRLERSFIVIRDNMLLLLVPLCFNSFGTASTVSLSVLTWIYFGITIIYAIFVLISDFKYLRAFMNFIFFVLTLIMCCLGLKHGW